jgi:hypothetical protein
MAGLLAVTGCASAKKLPTLYMTLDQKNGSKPAWIKTYEDSNVLGLEKMSLYKGNYCFVGEQSGRDLQSTQSWAESEAPGYIAQNISVRIEGLVKSQLQGNTVDASSFDIQSLQNNITSASFAGARKANDWWELRRRFDPDDQEKFEDTYTAYALYIINKDNLNKQIAARLKTLMDDVTYAEERAIYSSLIETILQNGLDLEPVTDIKRD